MRHLKIQGIIVLIAASAALAPCAAVAAPARQSACAAKADSEGMRGGVRRTYLRECLAGRDLDRRKHKTFQGSSKATGGKDHRCIGASKLGKCER